MKIRITTERLPNKYPKGEIYEVEELEGALHSLVSQNEAEIVEEKTVEQIDAEVMDYKEVPVEEVIEELEKPMSERDTIKAELKEQGIEFKGNAKTTALKELLESKKKS